MEFYGQFMTTRIFSRLVKMVGRDIAIVSICQLWRITRFGVGEKYDIKNMVLR